MRVSSLCLDFFGSLSLALLSFYDEFILLYVVVVVAAAEYLKRETHFEIPSFSSARVTSTSAGCATTRTRPSNSS